MTTVQHTPGPWTFHDDWQISDDANNTPICLVRHGITDEARQLANARLIATTPELLSVVGEIAYGLQEYLEEHGDCEHDSIVDLLRQASAVIARAEGRES